MVGVAHTARHKKTRIISTRTKSDLRRLDATSDANIDNSNIPELDATFFRGARVVVSPGRKQLTVRLDADVLAWLQDQGKGYHSRTNAILRANYEAHPDRAKL